MAHKTFCDICDSELEYHELVRVEKRYRGGEYCIKCWYDEKNWKVIHEKSASEMDD